MKTVRAGEVDINFFTWKVVEKTLSLFRTCDPLSAISAPVLFSSSWNLSHLRYLRLRFGKTAVYNQKTHFQILFQKSD